MADVQYDAEFLEFVVREVMRRLKADGHALLAENSHGKAARELTVQDRLVTLATVHGKLDGVQQLHVARRAIVTPAVRDELSKRQIKLTREN